MKCKSQYHVRLNATGEPDVGFYIAQANKLRSETIAQWLKEAKCWVKQRLHRDCVASTKVAYR